jgi:Spy/CpxP family protein refolding chaperone
MVRKLTAGALVVGMLAGGAVFAQGPGDGRGRAGAPGRAGGAGRGAGLPLAALNLTQVQQDAVADIRQRGRVDMQEIQARMDREILSVLSPAQQEQLKKVQAEREARRQQSEARRKQRQQQ